MRTHPARFVLAATAASALSFTLAAQQTIQVSDTGAQVRILGAAGESRASVSRDGGSTWTALPTPDYSLNWRGRSFDPQVGDPGIPSSLKAGPSNELFYVQFVTDIIAEYAQAMEQLGADVTRYYPNQAYIVRIARDKIAEVRDQPYVRAVMELDIGHKLDQEIQIGLEHGVLPTARYNVVMVDKHKDTGAVEAAIQNAGGVLEMSANGSSMVEATLTPAQLMSVASENTVLWIDRWTAPEYDIGNARIQAGVNYVRNIEGTDGKGIRGHINEGIFATHPEFAARAPYRTDPLSLMGSGGTSHGTNTAGEIYAQGLPGGVMGILPYGQLLYSPNIGGTQRYFMVQTLVSPSDPYQAVMMTQSWGGGRTTSYTSTSALLDEILFAFPRMFSTNSQSNAGARPSRPEAWAKNVCGIGGFLHRNNTDPTDDCWCTTGSIGPAQDGRVGVSFSAYYDAIRTTAGTSGYTNNFGGTSGATPIVNGLAGFAIQMFTDGLLGYPGVPWDQRFGARPNLTTTRVLLAVTTRQLSFTGSNKALRVQQGWGFPNMQDIYDNRDNILLLDEEDVLSDGQSRTYFVWVKPGTPEFRASMHHLESQAVPSAIPTRINSLDLSVLDPSGNTYWGNDTGILNGPWSSPGGSANDIDIHENVFIQNPASGVYRVTVTAAAVRQDSHVETPQVDADFALAIRGIGGGRDKSGMVMDLISNAPKQLDVSLSNVPAGGWSFGFTLFSFDNSRYVSLGDTFGLMFDALTNNIIQKGPQPGNVFSFTNSANPSHYPNATFSFGPGAVKPVQGMDIDAVTVLFDGSGNIVDVSNVDRVTIQ